jgi:serpin B
MFSKQSQPRVVLGLLIIALLAVAQVRATEFGFWERRSMRRVIRMERRGRSCPAAERVAVSMDSSQEVKQSDVEAGSGAQVTGDVRAVARSINQFAFDLYRRQNAANGNRFCSPASIATVLAMTYPGAENETRTQMAHVLHFELPDARLQDGFGKLNTILNTKSKSYQLSVANRLWGQSGFPFAAPFLSTIREHYAAEVGAVDFARPEQARQTINAWGAEKTHGKIAELIPAGVLTEKSGFVLTSAIYFKGTWQYRFAKTDTQDAPFHVSKDREIKAPMMKQTGAFQYAQTADSQLLELPYVGRHLSMVVLLPKQIDGLSKLEEKLSAGDMQKWISSLEHAHDVDVHLPKFTFTSHLGLKDVLSSMGMPRAFSDQADFTGISTEKRQKLFDVIHEAFVDVNEEGTEAAAVTGGHGGNAPGPVFEKIIFRADHPFLFLIHDNRTGAILFLGRVVNPK